MHDDEPFLHNATELLTYVYWWWADIFHFQDPKVAAVAAAVLQEQEDRELQEAMEATGMSIYPDVYDHIGYRRRRMMSVGNVSAPPILNRNFRFSSIGKPEKKNTSIMMIMPVMRSNELYVNQYFGYICRWLQ